MTQTAYPIANSVFANHILRPYEACTREARRDIQLATDALARFMRGDWGDKGSQALIDGNNARMKNPGEESKIVGFYKGGIVIVARIKAGEDKPVIASLNIASEKGMSPVDRDAVAHGAAA